MQSSLCGVDEAGRGALAGPLVVASVRIEDPIVAAQYFARLPVRDSKTLSEKQREAVYEAVCEYNIPFQTVCIEVREINTNGIGWANTEGIKLVILQAPPSKAWQSVAKPCLEVIVDGYFPAKKIAVPGVNVRCQVDADATVLPVILAGIMAKVTRDRIMRKLHGEWEHYGWKKNKGYGTRLHIEAIRTYGMCEYHRKQFVTTALGN